MFSSVTNWLGVGTRPKESDENKENDRQTEQGQSHSESKDSISSTSVETSVGSSKEGLSETGSEDNELKASTTSDSSQEASPFDTLEDVSAKALSTAKEFGNILFSFGKAASKTMADTATKLKNTVEEKTILGDFSKEQDKFVEQKKEKRKQQEAAVAPWVGYSDEDELKTQILALSKDKRNFVRNPPSGVQFQFDFDSASPVATATLQEDSNLRDMRFQLVPKQVSEETFWRNYFYRVSLIRQSSQLTSSLAQQSGRSSGSSSRRSSTGSDKKDSSSSSSSPGQKKKQDAEKKQQEDAEAEERDLASSPPGQDEFVSDAFGESGLSEEEIRREMEQQMLGGASPAKDEQLQDLKKDLEEKLLEQQGTAL
ncbi:hypothetical protein PoB_005991200 [Plakobranchus ocellatus]|uniref:BSD domain-containing protein n=1 Tax=Plakobranchus ocellatus TaxID=259542 RepID=A0AAV4CN92_9GAST|nr:hypothetical protein PoB_005991200 [Plakobranchus ocellatus]